MDVPCRWPQKFSPTVRYTGQTITRQRAVAIRPYTVYGTVYSPSATGIAIPSLKNYLVVVLQNVIEIGINLIEGSIGWKASTCRIVDRG
jgi:hypothetical protein